MPDRRRNRIPRLVLCILLTISATYQIRSSKDVFDFLFHPEQRVRAPFLLVPSSALVELPEPEAARAGLRRGDRVVSVNGRTLAGSSVLFSELDRARINRLLRLRVRRPGESEEKEFTIRLETDVFHWSSLTEKLLLVVLGGLAMPWFCLAIGYWTAFLRPRDRRAWCLLGLMLGFSTSVVFASLSGWQGWLRPLALAYHGFCRGGWPIWMLLFGLYFPEPLPFDRLIRWLKWVFILPLAFFALSDIYLELATAENFALAVPLYQLLRPYRTPLFVLVLLAISVFFVALSIRRRLVTRADARRRLNLLYFGTSLSLTPSILVIVYGLIRGGEAVNHLPQWVLFPPLLLLILFPGTLAYVIVVERAMDVRVVIRQGLRHALARNSVRALQVLLTFGIAVSAAALALDPATHRPEKTGGIVVGLLLVILVRSYAAKLGIWIDRRFFREAYNAEQILSELSDSVRTMVEGGPMLETVARCISDLLHVNRIAFLTRNNGGYSPAYTLGYAGDLSTAFPADGGTVKELLRRNGPLLVYFDDPDCWIYREEAVDDAERTRLRDLDAQLLLLLPVKDKFLGFVSLGPKLSEEPYAKTDLRLLQSVMTQTGLALEISHLTAAMTAEVAQRERMNRELEIAREVQQRLFPQDLPAVPGIVYNGHCRPAEGVGGDYYDFLQLPEGKLGIAIGDVSGKGISAALLMASLQASLRSQTINGAANLASLMRNLNRLIYDASLPNRFATFFYAQYEPESRRLSYVNAGHNPPILLRAAGGEIVRLETGGTVIGLFRETAYEQDTLSLKADDLLVAFTDGISEAMNAEDDEWGEQRLVETIRVAKCTPPIEIISKILAGADAFAAGAPQHDDMTLAVIRVIPG